MTLDTDRMTGAELKVAREWLGLTTRWLADHLDVAERTVHRWEAGVTPIPAGVQQQFEALELDTAGVVEAAVEACNDMRDPAIVTYRIDDEYRAHHPGTMWPASWHRAVVGRVAHEVPGLVIVYWSPPVTARQLDEG